MSIVSMTQHLEFPLHDAAKVVHDVSQDFATCLPSDVILLPSMFDDVLIESRWDWQPRPQCARWYAVCIPSYFSSLSRLLVWLKNEDTGILQRQECQPLWYAVNLDAGLWIFI